MTAPPDRHPHGRRELHLHRHAATRDATRSCSAARRTRSVSTSPTATRRKGDVTLSGVYNGSRADIDPVTFGRTRLGSYTLVNLATSYRLTDNLTPTGRVENLLNRHYEEVAGFGTASVGFYAGLKLAF